MMEEDDRKDYARDCDSEGSIEDVECDSSNVESDSDRDSEEEEFHWEDEYEPMLDEDTLLQIKRNDPSLTSIDVHCFDHCIGGEDAGHIIGQSPHLKKLLIKGEAMEWEDDFKRTSFLLGRFCKGLAKNRSIEHVMISCCEFSVGDESVIDPRIKKLQQFTIIKMAQFCQLNTNLQSLKLECCNLRNKSTRVLAMVLARKSNKSSLQRVNLCSNEIDDVAAKELIESLQGYGNLLEISLADNDVGVKGCVALESLVSSRTSNLKELNLHNNQIEDKGIAILARAFIRNTTLKEVDLGYNFEVTEAGWQQFFICLQNSSSSLEYLDLGANRISDKGIFSLGSALVNNTTLTALDLSSRLQPLIPITADGWRLFFSCLQSSRSVLQDIYLGGCGIDEKGLVVVTNAVSSNSTLKVLDLSNNPQITVAAWHSFFTTCLQSPNSSLEGLFLCENLTNDADEVVAGLAGAIAHNEKLEAIDLGTNPSITKTGWTHFSRLLCDKSSITRIYESNHNVNYFGPERLPRYLNDLVKLNEHENKKEVAREKILRYHFRDGANIQEFLDLKLKVLPHAISWLGRDCSLAGTEDTGRSHLYQLLRSIPSLFESKNRARGTKRKRC